MDQDEEFSAYVATHWTRLVRSAVLLGCSHAEAEDVVQTALEKCLLNWRRVQRAEHPDAYVHRVLINTFTSSRRRRWVGERPTAAPPEPPGSGDDATHRVDDTDAVVRALRSLPAEQRAVVVLRYYAHLSEAQLAAALGIPVGTVKSRLSRALKALAHDAHLSELRGTP